MNLNGETWTCLRPRHCWCRESVTSITSEDFPSFVGKDCEILFKKVK